MSRNVFQDTGDQKDFEDSLELDAKAAKAKDVAEKFQNTDSEIPSLDLRGLWAAETGFTTTAQVLIEQQERRGEASKE